MRATGPVVHHCLHNIIRTFTAFTHLCTPSVHALHARTHTAAARMQRLSNTHCQHACNAFQTHCHSMHARTHTAAACMQCLSNTHCRSTHAAPFKYTHCRSMHAVPFKHTLPQHACSLNSHCCSKHAVLFTPCATLLSL